MRKAIVLLMLVALFAISAIGQETMPKIWLDYLEMLVDEGDDETVEELMEIYAEYSESPLNLNDTTGALERFPFIGQMQMAGLRAYVALYGPLTSIEELYAIRGYDSSTVELLRPITRVGQMETGKQPTWKQLLRQGRSNLVTGVSGTIEQARGYRDSIYEGNNMRVMWRYTFKCKERLQLQLSGDKDPGEALFAGSQKRGFDFYGYSLMVNDVLRYDSKTNKQHSVYAERIMIGQYHARFGQGLTLWTGYGWRTGYGANVCRYGQGIRPNGAFMEYGYLHGAAVTLAAAKHWALTVLYSNADRDATLPRGLSPDGEVDRVQSVYNSGYHRTQTEINKTGMLGETVTAGHVEYRNTNLRIGATGVAMLLDKPIVPATYVYNDNVFRGKENANAGVDFMWRHGRMLWFGEAAMCVNRASADSSINIAPAALAGWEFVINNSHRLAAQAHYYSPTHHNLHSSAMGQNSSPQNETGCGLYYQGHLPLGIEAHATADVYYFPHMKYLVYGPSHGKDCRIALSHPLGVVKGLTVGVRYRYKDKGRNITPSTQVDGKYLMEQTYRHQVYADIVYERSGWRFTTKAGYTDYSGDVTEGSRGLLLYQDIQYRGSRLPMTLAARIALFDVDDYEARMYATESDFIYQYSSAMYQNEGNRFYLLAKYDITPHWNIGVKYSITVYSDKDTFGSGYELIDGNRRQQWRVQMRLKW